MCTKGAYQPLHIPQSWLADKLMCLNVKKEKFRNFCNAEFSNSQAKSTYSRKSTYLGTAEFP